MSWEITGPNSINYPSILTQYSIKYHQRQNRQLNYFLRNGQGVIHHYLTAGKVPPFLIYSMAFTFASRYTKAKRWDDLVGAVQQTTNESPMDELICLCQKDRDPLSPIGGVRLVPFNAVEEIPYSLGYDPLNAPLLGSRPQNDATPSRPTPAATPDHPVAQISILQSETKTRHTASHPAPLTIPSGQQGGSADLSVGVGDEETHLGDAEDDNDADELQNDEEETTTPHNNATPPSQDQINAVRVCQSTYRINFVGFERVLKPCHWRTELAFFAIAWQCRRR